MQGEIMQTQTLEVKTTYDQLADQESLYRTIESLKNNGINASIAATSAEAREKALALIPDGSEVMTMSSVTLEHLGLTKEINTSSKYASVKNKLTAMDRATDSREMQKLGAAPDYTVGSVNAVTENGQVMIASNTGSQLPAYAYGAGQVIWVVGTQKIVKDLGSGLKRIHDYTLPLKSN